MAAVALGSGGCCEVGKPAAALFDATAPNDQGEYADMSLREADGRSCRAATPRDESGLLFLWM